MGIQDANTPLESQAYLMLGNDTAVSFAGGIVALFDGACVPYCVDVAWCPDPLLYPWYTTEIVTRMPVEAEDYRRVSMI